MGQKFIEKLQKKVKTKFLESQKKVLKMSRKSFCLKKMTNKKIKDYCIERKWNKGWNFLSRQPLSQEKLFPQKHEKFYEKF